MCVGLCWCGVLCGVLVCVVCLLCVLVYVGVGGVCVWWCVWCGRLKTSVCRFKTPPCVPAKTPVSHGDTCVLAAHTEAF